MTSDPLAEAEAIIEAEGAKLEEQMAQVNLTIRNLANAAMVPDTVATAALGIYTENMRGWAKATGKTTAEVMGMLSPQRKQLLMGMIIGALLCGQQMEFQFLGFKDE
jgi:hypothetical protein